MRDEIYRPTPDGASGDADDHPREQQAVAPDAALTWQSPAERNRLLRLWRREVQIRFGEKPRALRVAWALESLFSGKHGYAFASNGYLTDATGMSISDVQKGLALLDGEAIVRRIKRGRVTERAIWPRRMWPAEGVTTVAMSRHSHDVATHNLRRRTPRAPRTALAAAAASADLRERRTRERAANAAGAAAPDAARCAAEGVAEQEPAEAKAHPLTRRITAALETLQ